MSHCTGARRKERDDGEGVLAASRSRPSRLRSVTGCRAGRHAARRRQGLRFARAGLVGLLDRPVSEPVFVACLHGAGRPPWTPQADPRLDALAAGYALLLDVAGAALQCTGRQPHEGGGA